MNVRKMTKEELEQLSHSDIAYELLKEDKKTKNTAKLFDEVCKLLEIDENSKMDMIGDFYTNLTTDKRFLLLENAEWDLKEAHSVKMVVEEDDDDEQDVDVEDALQEEQVPEETIEEENYDEQGDDLEDIGDLVVVTEEEMDDNV